MNVRYDQSIESANLPTSDNTFKNKDFGLYRCMITKKYYIDDQLNITEKSDNPQVLYQAVILGGFKEGQFISNARVSTDLGGQYNYKEIGLRPTSKELHAVPLNKHDGDIVYIQFLQGDKSAPTIIGCGVSSLDKDNTGATKEIGPQNVSEYNGCKTEINKSGEFLFTRIGGEYNPTKDYFIPVNVDEYEGDSEEEFQAKIHCKDNEILIQDPQNKILFEKTEKRYTQVVGQTDDDEDIYKEIIDATSQKVTKTWKDGLEIVEDSANDKVTITTAGGLVVTLDGAADKCDIITNGGSEINVDGAADKIIVNANAIELGDAALEFICKSDKMKTYINAAIVDIFDLHVHNGNLGYPVIKTATPMTAATESAIASTKHKVE